MKWTLFATFFLTIPALAHGTTYYVAKTGSNSNTCAQAQSVSTPKLTLMGASGGVSCLASGDTLIIKAGTYAEQLDGNKIPSGTSWTTATKVQAASGETVTIQPAAGSGVIDAVSFYGRSYIILDGLVMDGTNTPANVLRIQEPADHIRVQNSILRNSPGNCAAQQGSNVAYTEFINLDIGSCGSTKMDHGVYISGNNTLVEHCRIHDVSGHGIHLYSTQNLVNTNTIRANEIYNNGSYGILLGSGSGNVAYNNFVRGNGFLQGAGGIRIGFGSPSNNQVYNNTIYANTAECINILSGSLNALVENNICWKNGSDAVNDSGSGSSLSNNLVIDPGFVSAASLDFHLQSTSSAIDKGIAVSIVTDDFAGVPRPQGVASDIGAYEYVGGSANPPAAPTNLQLSASQ